MALVLLDRSQETATANTTVSFTLLGASTGYQTLAGVGNTNTTYYGSTDGTNWEVGIGTYSTTGPTLTRTTILSSSNSGSAVTFSGTVTVWVDYPASTGIYTTRSGATPNLQAQPTDSTTTGGNARGAYAVDWQMSRSDATKVASGYGNVIGGGYSNVGTSPNGVTFALNTIAQTASTTIYLLANNANIKQNQLIIGTGIPANTFIQLTSGVPVTSSAATLTTGAISGTTLTFASSTGATVVAGMVLSGGTVSANTYIVSGSGLSWTVNNSQTATVTTATLYTITVSQAVTIGVGTSLNFYTPFGTVAGGSYNTASGTLSFVGGGGDASQFYFGNTAAGDYSAVAGGFACQIQATAPYAFIGSGNTNGVSQPYGVVVGGQNNSATGAYSAILGGYYGTTRGITGYQAIPACQNPLGYGYGYSQGGLLVLGAVTSNATATVLVSQIFASASATTQIALPNNSAYYFKGSVIANVTGAVDGAAWSFEGAIMRGANAASTVFIGTPQLNRVAATAGASAWSIALTANTTNGTLTVTVTGAASTTIRWVAKIETTEVTY